MKGEIVNFKPHKRTQQQGSTTGKELTLSLDKNSLENMFNDFVKMIDAAPNTVRTYSISLRQWFKYLQENNVSHPTPDTVLNYREYLRATGKKETTVQNYIIAVKQLFKWTEMRGIYPNIAQYVKGGKISKNFKKDYLTSKQAKKVLQSIDRTSIEGKRNYAMLALMLTTGLRTIEVVRANAEDLRVANIAQYVKGGKISKNFKKDYLTSKQARKVLESIDRNDIEGKRNYAMLALMLTTGLRTIEVVRANAEDLQVAGDNTVLYVQGKGHHEKDDLVRVPEHVEAAIRQYLSARKCKDLTQPLFTSTSNRNKNGRMTTRSVRGIVKKIFRSIGLDSPRLTAHSTRHTAATLSLLNGATPIETQHLLRHKNLQTTEIYAHNIDQAKNPASQDVEDVLFN